MWFFLMAALIFRCLKCPRLGWTGQPFTCVLGAGSRLTGETGFDPIVFIVDAPPSKQYDFPKKVLLFIKK